MGTLMATAGTLLLIGGIGQFWTSLQMYRQGKAWRGAGLMAAGLTVYGCLVLTGKVFNGTVAGAVLVWIIAAATWAGWWLSRRERKRSIR